MQIRVKMSSNVESTNAQTVAVEEVQKQTVGEEKKNGAEKTASPVKKGNGNDGTAPAAAPADDKSNGSNAEVKSNGEDKTISNVVDEKSNGEQKTVSAEVKNGDEEKVKNGEEHVVEENGKHSVNGTTVESKKREHPDENGDEETGEQQSPTQKKKRAEDQTSEAVATAVSAE